MLTSADGKGINMKNKIIKAAVMPLMTLALAFLLTTVQIQPALYAEAADDKKDSYEQKINALANQQKELLSKLEDIKKAENDTQAYTNQLNSAISVTQSKINTVTSLLEELNEELERLDVEIQETERSIEENYNRYLDRVRFTYENGNASYLELILGAESITDFLSRMERVGSMLEYDRNVVKTYKQQKENLESYKVSYEEARKTQEEALKTLEADKAYSQSLVGEYETYLTQLKKDENYYQSQYAEAKRQEEALDAELAQYLQSLQAKNPVPNQPGGGTAYTVKPGWPLPSGVGYVSSNYGSRMLWGVPDFHAAVDLACPMNTPIYALNAGTVVRAEWHYSYGYYVLVDHGGGIASLYAHCNSLLVSAGQTVEAGQNIGLVGMTGSADGYHVHVEIRENGTRVNPWPYLAN